MGRAYTSTGIQMIDTAGSAVVDSTGLVSETQFTNPAYYTGPYNVSGTSPQNLAPGTASLVVTRTTKVFIPLSAAIYLIEPAGNTCNAEIMMYTNAAGTDTTNLNLDSQFTLKVNTGNVDKKTLMTYYIPALSAGTHYFIPKGRLISQTGTASLQVDELKFSLLRMGN